MAKTSGLGDNFFVGGYDLSGDVSSVDTLGCPIDTINNTTIKQFGNSRIYSLRNGVMSFTSFFENTVAVSTPGVPLTGVPVVSTYNQLVYVNITGGTVTGVTVNGVNVGSGLGLYQLPALGTIVVAFTGALVWSWFSLNAEHNALAPRPTTDTVASYFRGSAVGNPAASFNCLQTDYDPTRDNTGNITLKVDLTGDKFGMDWGKMLTAGIRTDTAATVGAFFDDGAASSFGGQAYFHVFQVVGTSITIDIQSATTSGGAYSTTGLTSSAITPAGSPTSQRVAVSNTTTINEFLKVVTTGTFSLALFAVHFSRNPIAGVVF